MSSADESATPTAFTPDDPMPVWCVSAWEVLAARAASGSLPHALLVAGPAGLGKRVLVEAFVRARLCESPAGGRACGHCRTCRLLAAGTHPDRVLVTLEENPKTHKMRSGIVVEQIRALSARLAMASQFGGWQVAVIDPAEAMNSASQNALLKTLEEPTPSSLIVLVSDQPWRLSATVRSRCQRVDIAVPAAADAAAWLHARGLDSVEALLAASGGNPGQAWLLAEHGGMQRRQEVARDLLALAAGRGNARAIGRAWADDEPDQRLQQAARLLEGALRARAEDRRARFDPGWDDTALAAGCAGANRLRILLDGPLRGDLALFDWLNGLPVAAGQGKSD